MSATTTTAVNKRRRRPAIRPGESQPNLPRTVLGLILRIALGLVFGLPLVFMIVSSFKPDLQIFADLGTWKAFVPIGTMNLDNYLGVFGRVPFATFLMNSVLISVSTVALGLVVNSMAAFALSRITFRGHKVVLGVILATSSCRSRRWPCRCCGG